MYNMGILHILYPVLGVLTKLVSIFYKPYLLLTHDSFWIAPEPSTRNNVSKYCK